MLVTPLILVSSTKVFEGVPMLVTPLILVSSIKVFEGVPRGDFFQKVPPWHKKRLGHRIARSVVYYVL